MMNLCSSCVVCNMVQYCYDMRLHDIHSVWALNSLSTGRVEQNFRLVISRVISVTDGWCVSCKIALRWMPLDLTDDKSTLVQVMAWCCQATSHYLSQCWSSFMSPYGAIRPQSVNSLSPGECGFDFRTCNFNPWLFEFSILVLLPPGEWCRTLLMISQHCVRWWLGAIRQQAITWSNVD